MNLSGRIGRNSLSLISITLLARGARGSALLVIVRFFGQEMVGQYALVITTAELFRVVSDFGVDIVVTKGLLDPTRDRSGLVGVAARLKFFTTSLAALSAIGTGVLLGFSDEVVWGIVVVSAGFYISAYTNLLRATYEAELAVGKLLRPTIVVRSVYFLLVVLGLWAGMGVVGIVSLAVVTDALLLLYVLLKAKDRGYALTSVTGTSIRELFSSAIPIGVLGLVVTAYARLSTIILAKLGGEVAVAYWTSAHRIAEVVLLATGAFATSMLPVFSRYIYEKTSLRESHKMFFPYFRKLVLLVMGGALVLALFSEQIISIIFTPAYSDASTALAVLSGWTIFASANMFLTNMLYAAERQRTVLSIAVFNLVLNVFLNLQLIPMLGFLGAAVAAVVTESVNTVLQTGAVLRGRRFLVWGREFVWFGVRVLLWMGAAMVILLAYTGGVPVVVAVVIASVYMFHLFVFKDLLPREILMAARSVLARRT
jgi:PST family polysaccharide transporter